MKLRLRALLALLLLVCALVLPTACSSPGNVVYVGLKVVLNGITHTAGGTTTVHWSVVNPNVTPYLLSRVKSKIFLNGTLVGTIADDNPLAVPAQNIAKRSSPLVPAGADALRLLTESTGQAPVSYRAESDIVVLIYDDSTEQGKLSDTGTVAVVGQ